jgi:hypothetical protein
VSGAVTPLISEICCTSSSAATRGMKFLPNALAGAAMCVNWPESGMISAARLSAVIPAYCGESQCRTFFTPATLAAAWAASAH